MPTQSLFQAMPPEPKPNSPNSLRFQTQKYLSAYHIAAIYVALKDNLHALEWLDKAYQDRADWMVFLKVDPRFKSLHSDQKFIELLRRMNL